MQALGKDSAPSSVRGNLLDELSLFWPVCLSLLLHDAIPSWDDSTR